MTMDRKNEVRGRYNVPLEVDHMVYQLHVELLVDGVQGYVVHDGDFMCTLPWVDNQQELINVATERIRQMS